MKNKQERTTRKLKKKSTEKNLPFKFQNLLIIKIGYLWHIKKKIDHWDVIENLRIDPAYK